MTEQYKDAYQNKYREETAQVHAPLSLIVKTKAAVREEEKRLAAAAEPKKQARTFSIRKWGYPLTAVAAILILASVSLTMRSLKSADMTGAPSAVYDGAAESGAVYENAVESADAGYAEGVAEAPASETPMMEAEEPEEAAAEEIMADMAADTAESVTEAENSDGAASSELMNETSRDIGNAEMETSEDKLVEELTEGAADRTSQKKEMAGELQRGDADYDDYTIEKVAKRPAGFNDSEVMIRRYEGKTFRVLEMTRRGNDSEKAWTAYVELSTGEGYVICGEAESVDDFLEAAHKKLEKERE